MSTRIYLVTDVETNKHRLIRAGICQGTARLVCQR